MSQEVVRAITSIVMGIIGIAILAVLLSKNATTLGLVQNLSAGLSQDISAATSPVTNGGGFGSMPTMAPSFASS